MAPRVKNLKVHITGCVIAGVAFEEAFSHRGGSLIASPSLSLGVNNFDRHFDIRSIQVSVRVVFTKEPLGADATAFVSYSGGQNNQRSSTGDAGPFIHSSLCLNAFHLVR